LEGEISADILQEVLQLEIFIYQAELVSTSCELEVIIKDASLAAKYIIDTAWEIRHYPRVSEELKQYLNSAIA
jgi:hypothetical protein